MRHNYQFLTCGFSLSSRRTRSKKQTQTPKNPPLFFILLHSFHLHLHSFLSISILSLSISDSFSFPLHLHSFGCHSNSLLSTTRRYFTPNRPRSAHSVRAAGSAHAAPYAAQRARPGRAQRAAAAARRSACSTSGASGARQQSAHRVLSGATIFFF